MTARYNLWNWGKFLYFGYNCVPYFNRVIFLKYFNHLKTFHCDDKGFAVSLFALLTFLSKHFVWQIQWERVWARCSVDKNLNEENLRERKLSYLFTISYINERKTSALHNKSTRGDVTVTDILIDLYWTVAVLKTLTHSLSFSHDIVHLYGNVIKWTKRNKNIHGLCPGSCGTDKTRCYVVCYQGENETRLRSKKTFFEYILRILQNEFSTAPAAQQ